MLLPAVSTLLLLLLGPLALWVPCVQAHGYLKLPASRNYLANSDYCPHCLNAGGVRVVYGPSDSYPNGRYGVCGDPYTDPAPRNHEAGGKYWTGNPAATYVQGQTIEIDLVITTNHYGRFEFKICEVGLSSDAERKELSQDCFDQHQLVQANIPQAQAPGEKYFYTSPQDPVYNEYTMYYKLPENVTCNGGTSRCVLQWHWESGNTCTPPGTPVEYQVPSNLQQCGPGVSPPEEFWNCADLLILGKDMLGVSRVSPGTFSPLVNIQTTSSTTGTSNVQTATTNLRNMSRAVQMEFMTVKPQYTPYPLSYANYHCAQLQQYGKFADVQRACTGYFFCSNTDSWYFTCAEGLLFSEELLMCTYPADVVCPIQGIQIQSATTTPFWVF